MDQLARTRNVADPSLAEADRCTTIAGRPVCRRCLTLYPAAIAVGIAFLLGWSLWPAAADPWLIWALCLPATADFVLEQTGNVDYSARRQVLTTALLAPAVGRGLGYELTDSWSGSSGVLCSPSARSGLWQPQPVHCATTKRSMPMAEYRGTVRVAADPSEVLPYVADLTNLTEWDSSVPRRGPCRSVWSCSSPAI